MDGNSSQSAEKGNSKNATLSLPSSWPGAFGAYKYSKQAMMVNIGVIIAVYLIGIIVVFLLQTILKAPGSILGYIIDALIGATITVLIIAGLRQQKVELGDAFSKGVKLWLNFFLLEILIGVTAVVSFILLVIPFFFVVPRLALAPYFLVDKGMGVVDAYKASWDATKGNVGKVYGIFFASVLMALLSITIIGIPFSIYFLVMYAAAYAVLYEMVDKKQTVPAAASTRAAAAPAS